MTMYRFATGCCAFVLCALLAGGQALAADSKDNKAPKKEAVEKKAAKEGDLDKYINPDSDDLNTKIDVITHTLYEEEQHVIALTFMQEYGDHVRLKRVAFASADRTLIPGYIFTPLKLEAGKKYPGIVMVHGGFHERFDGSGHVWG